MNSIPLIGIPVLNRGDLLLRCVNSFDYPVDHIVIINNGKDAGVRHAIEELINNHPQRANISIHSPEHNLGFSASCNFICGVPATDAGYRMIVGNDMVFEAGALQKFHEFTRARVDDYAMVRCFQGYGIIALTERGIKNVGGFDESFYPAYFEDNDHHRRLRLLGEKDTDVSIPLFHGEHGKGSCTINSDPAFAARQSITFGNNCRYYQRKWGGMPHHEPFLHPFNDASKPLNGWIRDEENYQENFAAINGR